MAPLEVKYHGIDAQFNETYDSAPPLPHPLKSEHALKYITGQWLLNESLSVAPLTKEEDDRVVEIGLGEVRATDDPSVVRYLSTRMGGGVDDR